MQLTFFNIFIVISICYFNAGAVPPKGLYCDGATVHQVRINGCNEQPCTIQKGHPLPFEVDISIDDGFGQADRFSFEVYIPSRTIWPWGGGKIISRDNCDDGTVMGVNCPLQPNVVNTLRSELLIEDKEGSSTKSVGTGENETVWSVRMSNNQVTDSYAACNLKITVNVTE